MNQINKKTVCNGIQTNGTLLDDDWCRFLAAEGFAVGISIDGPAGNARPIPPDERRPAGP